MSTPTISPGFFEPPSSSKRRLYVIGVVSALAIGPFMIWPRAGRALAGDQLPATSVLLFEESRLGVDPRGRGFTHWDRISCDLSHAGVPGLQGASRRDIPFRWMFLSFGLFIIACGGTHFMEVVTIWIPVYIFSAAVKLFTAVASLTTAAVLPFTVPRILTLVQQAKASEQNTAKLRASEERKGALLREVHHRVKNNLAIICSLFYLQSTHTKDEETIQIFPQPARYGDKTAFYRRDVRPTSPCMLRTANTMPGVSSAIRK